MERKKRRKNEQERGSEGEEGKKKKTQERKLRTKKTLKLTASGESLQNSSRGSALVCWAFLWDSAAEISSTCEEKVRVFVVVGGGGRKRSSRVREVSFLCLARLLLFRFLSSFFHESISSRSRPFWPRSAPPRARKRSKQPRGGGGTPAKASNNAPPPLPFDQTNQRKRKRCRGR